MPPNVLYHTERRCCDREDDVTLRTKSVAHIRSTNGAWVRSACCGRLHFCERVPAGDARADSQTTS
jgi:hypothetical protein